MCGGIFTWEWGTVGWNGIWSQNVSKIISSIFPDHWTVWIHRTPVPIPPHKIGAYVSRIHGQSQECKKISYDA